MIEASTRRLDRSAKTYVAGHGGLAGSAIWRRLTIEGFTGLIGRRSTELDLRDRRQVFAFFEEVRPEAVILAAAKVGGIVANNTWPADFLSENLQIQVNVMDAAARIGVDRLLFLGSSCIYPKFAPQPITEDSLLTGHLEPTNDAYAVAKIAGIFQVQAVRRQHGLRWISAMPTNLYGPGDNFSQSASHVLPGLIRRYETARIESSPVVVNWGSGSPRREFLHAYDMADAVLHILDNYDDPSPINLGVGSDLTIRSLATIVSDAVGYRGRTEWDTSKPDGTPRKVLDISRISALGWRPQITLSEGIAGTVEWFRNNSAALRT